MTVQPPARPTPDPATPLDEKLFGLIWNHQKNPSHPLWWCLDEKLKQTFRETLIAELERKDPTARPDFSDLRAE